MSHDAVPATLVAAAAVLAAALGLRASMLSGTASDRLQSSVRVEVKHGAADVQDALLVFGEAPVAARAAAARFRSDELVREAAAVDPATARELTIEATIAGALARSVGGTDGGAAALQVDRRLDERRAQQALGPESAAQLADAGGDAGRRATLTSGAAALAGLAFLLGSLGQAFRRGRGALVAAGIAALAVSLAAGIVLETV